MRKTFLLVLSGACVIANAQFSSGNLVVRIVGDGNATTTGAIPTSLRQYTTAGAPVGSDIPLTNLPNGRNLCCSYGETSETALEISDDNRFLMVTGYDVPSRDPGFDSFLSNRAVGRISLANGSVVLSNTYVPDLGDGTRGVSSPDGDQFLVCGGDMGLIGGTFNTAPSQILPNIVSSRHIHKVNGIWYFLGSNAGPGGTNGVATWDGVNQTPVFETPNGASGRNFKFANADTFYLCTSTGAQGLMKMVKTGGVWTMAYQLGGTGVGNLAVDGNTIYVTSSNGATILKTTDTGSSFTAYTTVATAEANTRFRGLVMVPSTNSPETLAPTAEQIVFGTTNSGGNLASWAADDANGRKVCRFFIPNAQIMTRMRLSYTTTKLAPTAISFNVKISAHTPIVQLVTLRVENKVTNLFVDTNVVLANIVDGSTYNGVPTGTLANYVGGGGAMRGEIEIKQTGISALSFPCTTFEFGQMVVTG